MAIATLTSKGQTTIPQQIRSYLGLHAGDILEFIIDEEGKVILTPHTVDAKELKKILPKPKKKVTIEQMNKIIAQRGAGL